MDKRVLLMIVKHLGKVEEGDDWWQFANLAACIIKSHPKEPFALIRILIKFCRTQETGNRDPLKRIKSTTLNIVPETEHTGHQDCLSALRSAPHSVIATQKNLLRNALSKLVFSCLMNPSELLWMALLFTHLFS